MLQKEQLVTGQAWQSWLAISPKPVEQQVQVLFRLLEAMHEPSE